MGSTAQETPRRRDTTLTFISGGSGGIGKSGNARALAALLGHHGHHVVLVDGNPGQQSQRRWHALDDMSMLENAQWLGQLGKALIMPRQLGQSYALLPGPADPLAPGMNDLYGKALYMLKSIPATDPGHVDAIIVDTDRIDQTLWEQSGSFANHVIRPFMQAGLASMIFRLGQTGSQAGDGLRALAAVNMPGQVCATVQAPATLAKPRSDSEWKRILAPVARYAGCDRWSPDSLAEQQPGTRLNPQATDWLCRQAAFIGFHVEPERRKGLSWFHHR